MASNFFAALDDSGDEGNFKKAAPAKKAASAKDASAKKDSGKARSANNDRNTKGGRGPRPPARDGKRQYDRRSGTGRGKEIKKGGGGARNWGSDKNDAKKAEGSVVEGEEDDAETEEKRTVEVEVEEEEEEEEDHKMTMEEYLATKANPDSDAFKNLAVRDVDNEFAGKEAKKSVEEEFLVSSGGKSLRKKGTKSQKQTVDVGFRIGRPSSSDDYERSDRGPRRDGGGRGERRSGGREGRGRGGRGGREGRGGRGGREGRGGRGRGRGGGGGRGRGLNVNDSSAFPSL